MVKLAKLFSEHSLKNIKSFVTMKREPFFQIAKDYIKLDSVILDIGAGTGDFAKYLGRNDVHMIDGNQTTVDLLKKEFENVYYCILPTLPFENKKFDVIHTSHLIEYLTPKELYDSLKEIDRCLKADGVLVISAPLLWTGFYSDMGHLKPYDPNVFINYLCSGGGRSQTRIIVSNKYSVAKMQYRYGYNHSHLKSYYFIRSNILNMLFFIIQLGIYLIGFRKLEITGYTIVLKKEFE